MARKKADPLARFLALTRVEEDTGCRIWIGARDDDKYGQFSDENGDTKQAHNWIWQHIHGPITETDDDGRPLEVDHKCRRRECTNTYKDPEMPGGIGGCLELVTHAENMRRQREAQRRLKEVKKAAHSVDLEEKLKEQAKLIDKRAVEIEKASPLEKSFRKKEIARQLAGLIITRDRWIALEQLGELEPEKSRQLGRISSDIRKHFDELGIEQSKGPDKKAMGFLGALGARAKRSKRK
jgi:hypothetical protein